MIKVSKSIVGKEESDAVDNVIRNIGYLGMGEEVGSFENELELFIGNPDYKAVCVNTGTSALHLAIESVTNHGYSLSFMIIDCLTLKVLFRDQKQCYLLTFFLFLIN